MTTVRDAFYARVSSEQQAASHTVDGEDGSRPVALDRVRRAPLARTAWYCLKSSDTAGCRTSIDNPWRGRQTSIGESWCRRQFS